MLVACVSIEVHGTFVSPSRTCINGVVEHIVCAENYYYFELGVLCSALSVSPTCTLCVKFPLNLLLIILLLSSKAGLFYASARLLSQMNMLSPGVIALIPLLLM